MWFTLSAPSLRDAHHDLLRSRAGSFFAMLLYLVRLMVAEKSSVLRFCGTPSKMAFIAVGEAHVEHLVSLVEHHVLNLVELCHATVHEVDESSRCGHDDLCAVLQRMDLVNDAGASINSHHVDALDILGKIFQVVSDL